MRKARTVGRFSDYELFLLTMCAFFVAPPALFAALQVAHDYGWAAAPAWAACVSIGIVAVLRSAQLHHPGIAVAILLALIAASTLMMIVGLTAF